MISICIPAYKHVSLTHEAAISILKQDVDVELVILNDFYLNEKTSSNLNSINELENYLHADKRVKYFSNTNLLPIQDNWNKVVSLCSGKYIKLIGADDRLLPGSIIRMQELIFNNPSINFHGHLANIINENGDLIRRQRHFGKSFSGCEISGSAALKGKLRQKIRFKEPACNFYLKSAWEKSGGYEKKFRFTFDIHFNSKLMASNKSILWNEYLVELRRHQESDGSQLSGSLALKDLSGLIAEILFLLGPDATMLDRAAGNGWLEYRVVELFAQRIKYWPSDAINLLLKNLNVFFRNPTAYVYFLKILINRLKHGDVQAI